MTAVLRRFPAGFKWGAALSAHQAEGGNRANDWWRFERVPGKIADGAVSGDACRHFEQFDDDFARAAADGHGAHRLSLEWSRIEPERGKIDSAAIAHYHEVFASLARRRLMPVVTLHHFTNPLWIADAGGWENRVTIDRFCDFVRLCAREFGGQVDWWCTINEPEVLAFRAYSEGLWPPARRDDSAALAVMANLLEAHGRASRILREEDKTDADGDGHATRIGFAKHYVELEPARPWFPLDLVRAHFENAVFNRAVMSALGGEIALSIPGARPVRRRVPELKDSSDWFGLNYYTRWQVKMFAPEAHVPRAHSERTDLGWEIRPRGLGEVAARVAAATRLPVLVTEHGFADAADAFRPRALVESLLHLADSIAHGTPVLGYLHWSLLDNFEWSDGYRGRFGLYRVDFSAPSRTRTRTRSADLLARIARANAIMSDVAGEAGLAL